jgi:hypothetical protein
MDKHMSHSLVLDLSVRLSSLLLEIDSFFFVIFLPLFTTLEGLQIIDDWTPKAIKAHPIALKFMENNCRPPDPATAEPTPSFSTPLSSNDSSLSDDPSLYADFFLRFLSVPLTFYLSDV